MLSACLYFLSSGFNHHRRETVDKMVGVPAPVLCCPLEPASPLLLWSLILVPASGASLLPSGPYPKLTCPTLFSLYPMSLCNQVCPVKSMCWAVRWMAILWQGLPKPLYFHGWVGFSSEIENWTVWNSWGEPWAKWGWLKTVGHRL